MSTQQVLVRLPEELARRFKRQVPARGRSAFVQRLLEEALPPEAGEDDPLYRAALEVERDRGLASEMAEWDRTVGDGLLLGSSPDGKQRAEPHRLSPIRRGEVWWVDLDSARGSEIRKTRPAVVLSANGLNRARRTVVVVPLSTGPSPRPPIVVATPSAGPSSVAVCDQVRAVDKMRLARRDGQITGPDLRAVETGLRAVLEL